MAEFDHHAALWSRLKSRLRALCGNDRAREADEGQRQSRFQVEPLEPRILLSGDPVASELARLVDDATHATFIDDHAAVVEQVATDVVTDAGHADHSSPGVVVSDSSAGDARGVEWPSAWTQPTTSPDTVESAATTTSAANAAKVDLRMTVADLVAAFAAESQANPAIEFHLIAVAANQGPPTATGPPDTIEIEHTGTGPSNDLSTETSNQSSSAAQTTSTENQDGGVPTNAVAQADRIQTLLKSVLDGVRATITSGTDDAASQTSVAGLEIRMAKLKAGEVARLDGTVILVADDGDGAGWSLDGVAAADLTSHAASANIAAQPVDGDT
jgi:hypothetical protein